MRASMSQGRTSTTSVNIPRASSKRPIRAQLSIANNVRNVPPANYSLKYNVMPYVGYLTYGEIAKTAEPVAFPPSQPRV
jgi:hypothetical protein